MRSTPLAGERLRGANCGDDVGVGAAAADVAAHALANLVVSQLGIGGVPDLEETVTEAWPACALRARPTAEQIWPGVQ